MALPSCCLDICRKKKTLESAPSPWTFLRGRCRCRCRRCCRRRRAHCGKNMAQAILAKPLNVESYFFAQSFLPIWGLCTTI